MQKTDQKVYDRKLTMFLIWGPILGIPLILLLFAVFNTLLSASGTVGTTGSSISLTLTIANFFLTFLGLACTIGIFTALPYGIYRLKKSPSKSGIINSDGGQKFIKDVVFSPIDYLFKLIMGLNVLQVIGIIYLTVPSALIYQGINSPNSLSTDSQNFIQNFNFDSYSLMLLMINFLTAVIFFVWLRKAYRNLYHFGNKTSNTPGWVIVDFFIPIVNLVQPYKNMKELYEKTFGENETKLVWGWWLTLLATNFINRYVNSFAKNENTTNSDIANWIAIGIAGHLIQIVSLILAILVIKKITNKQTEKARK